MSTAPSQPEPPPAAPPFTIRHQWALLAIVGLLLSASCAAQLAAFPEQIAGNRVTAFHFVDFILFGLAHAGWISLDRRRRGLDVGAWRLAAILLGPLAIWAYLLREYRLKALLFIPLSALLYLVPFLLGFMIATILRPPAA